MLDGNLHHDISSEGLVYEQKFINYADSQCNSDRKIFLINKIRAYRLNSSNAFQGQNPCNLLKTVERETRIELATFSLGNWS
jgi:hypothetical protein